MATQHKTWRRLLQGAACGVVSAALTFSPSPSAEAAGECSQPVSTGALTTSSDSRFILLAAVGARSCDLCLCDIDGSGATMATDALIALNLAVGLPMELNCPVCGADAECPGIAQFVLLSKIRGPCASDADCEGLGTCDVSLGRCRTVTDLDVGWTGLAHGMDLNDGVPARLELDCTGPAPCGECAVTGLDPQLGNCRCAHDNRTVCFEPHQPDAGSCGGERCECYFGPATPFSSGNAPTCVLNRLREELSGLVNVDAGSGMIDVALNEIVHLGIAMTQPCPFCDADSIPADGVRNGVCVGGLNDGETCDAQTFNSTFPAPGGGFHSLDCFPDPGKNISGVGLKVDLPLTTGAQQLSSNLACGILGMSTCPCRVCSGDTTLACEGDEDCSDAGAGTCTSAGIGITPQPNGCSDGQCADVGGNEGECVTGPDQRYCDAIVRGDGRGFISCLSNLDCDPGIIGVAAGECTIVERRGCFLDPIDSTGAANPFIPIAAGLFCTPPTGSAGINTVSGLSGPTRWIQQAVVQLFCANSPLMTYIPGVGGCPATD